MCKKTTQKQYIYNVKCNNSIQCFFFSNKWELSYSVVVFLQLKYQFRLWDLDCNEFIFFFFFFSLIELVFTSAVWEFCQHINSSFQCIHRCVQYKERNGFITWQKNGCSFRLVSLFTPSFLFSSLFPLFNYIVIGCFFLITTGASKLLLFLKPYCMKHAMFSTNHYTSSLFYYISNLHEKQIVEPDQ